MITLKQNKIEFSESAIKKLDLYEGDRILIGYMDDGKKLSPIIQKDETGNKFTKLCTCSFKGKPLIELSKYGTTFQIEEKNNMFYLKGDGIITEFEECTTFVVEPCKKETILDTNYNIEHFKNYTL